MYLARFLDPNWTIKLSQYNSITVFNIASKYIIDLLETQTAQYKGLILNLMTTTVILQQ